MAIFSPARTIFERVWLVGVLQTLQGMFATCPAMFVARWAGSYRFFQDMTVASGSSGGKVSVGRSDFSLVKTENERIASARASST